MCKLTTGTTTPIARENCQLTFGDATTGFPAKWFLRNECRNSILMTRRYPDLGKCFWLVESNFPHGTTNQEHYPDLGSDALSLWNFLHSFLRHHLAGKPVVESPICWLFSQVTSLIAKFSSPGCWTGLSLQAELIRVRAYWPTLNDPRRWLLYTPISNKVASVKNDALSMFHRPWCIIIINYVPTTSLKTN